VNRDAASPVGKQCLCQPAFSAFWRYAVAWTDNHRALHYW